MFWVDYIKFDVVTYMLCDHRETEEVVNQLLKQCATAKEIAASSKPAAPIE